MLAFIRSLVPGDIKGEIRKVRALLSFNDLQCLQCIKYKLLHYSKYLGTLGSLKVGGVQIVGVEGWMGVVNFLKFNRRFHG